MTKPLVTLLLLLGLSPASQARIDALYETRVDFALEDLVVEVNGYQVPTLDAFRGWMLFHQAREPIFEIRDYFLAQGVKPSLPLYLVLLQGTDWRLNDKSVFTLPKRQHWDNMVRTLKLIDQEILPELGDLVPVSGERSEEYNKIAGGASQSKHLTFCALDLVPEQPIAREELHRRLKAIHARVGRQYQMGLGLYSGLRFHIDTCGFRSW